MRKGIMSFYGDVIEWDIRNWSHALKFWARYVSESDGLNCLEIGAGKGGLSLWLATRGYNVVCSDIKHPEKAAEDLHRKYDVQRRIRYEAIDATNIPYENYFDVIAFKSVLGGIGRNHDFEKQKRTIIEIHKALAPGGKLLFAENLEGFIIHKFFRKHFVRWGKSWRYLKLDEIEEIFSCFPGIEYETRGFLGTFGRTENQRSVLGIIDNLTYSIVPKQMKYILIGVATK